MVSREHHIFQNKKNTKTYINTYCWWRKSCTIWDVPVVNNEINYQPQLVIAGFSSINSIIYTIKCSSFCFNSWGSQVPSIQVTVKDTPTASGWLKGFEKNANRGWSWEGWWMFRLHVGFHKYIDVSENSGFSPQIIHFNRVFHYKPSILGYPYFWKHPYWPIFMFSKKTSDSWNCNDLKERSAA